MDEAVGMRFADRIADRQGDGEGLRERQGPVLRRERGSEAEPVEELHDEVGLTRSLSLHGFELSGAVNGDEVRVQEPAGDATFSQEARDEITPLEVLAMQDLHGYGPTDARLRRA